MKCSFPPGSKADQGSRAARPAAGRSWKEKGNPVLGLLGRAAPTAAGPGCPSFLRPHFAGRSGLCGWKLSPTESCWLCDFALNHWDRGAGPLFPFDGKKRLALGGGALYHSKRSGLFFFLSTLPTFLPRWDTLPGEPTQGWFRRKLTCAAGHLLHSRWKPPRHLVVLRKPLPFEKRSGTAGGGVTSRGGVGGV